MEEPKVVNPIIAAAQRRTSLGMVARARERTLALRSAGAISQIEHDRRLYELRSQELANA